mgnify:CR=1 FL=1
MASEIRAQIVAPAQTAMDRLNLRMTNRWKLAAVAMALVIVTVVATGLVVANWRDKKMVDVSPGHPTLSVATPMRLHRRTAWRPDAVGD